MKLSERFEKIGEYYAAGLFENEDRSMFYRKSIASRKYYENCPLPEYHGEKLYPSGKIDLQTAIILDPAYNGFSIDDEKLRAKDEELYHILKNSDANNYKFFIEYPHDVGGKMSNHSIPNFERILAEGFDSYKERIQKIEDVDMREGLLEIIAGIRCFHTHCLEYLRSVDADKELIEALEIVPFKPCKNIIQALVGWNFILYIETRDMHPGCISQGLLPYYRGENIDAYLENMFRNIDLHHGWTMALNVQNSPLIVPCLKAACGRKPLVELFVDEDTSDEIWDVALENILNGCGQPAFYNKKLYLSGIKERFPEIRDEDMGKLCGGGCTELLIAGYSNVGTIDANINLLYILEETMYSHLKKTDSFEAFYRIYLDNVYTTMIRVMDEISQNQEYRAKNNPLPIRTLLMDDCIDRGLEYNNGGTRYAWSIIGFAGIINVIDSLCVIKDKVFTEKKYTKEVFLEKLRKNDTTFLEECKRNTHRHGIDDEETNLLTNDFTTKVFSYTKEKKPYIGFGFMPASVMFNLYGDCGKSVGATPCGRAAGEALADSLTSIFGKDTEGITALIKSVTSIDLKSALGGPVVNLTINPDFDKSILKSLIISYMKLGGMQLQISCFDQETIRKAYVHPENYPNLIVRVGGFCEYYCNLDEELKLKVLERTYYSK